MLSKNVKAKAELARLQFKLGTLRLFLGAKDNRIAAVLTELALFHRESQPEVAEKLWTEALAIYDANGVALPGRSLGLQYIIRGIHRFQGRVFTKEREFYKNLSRGQHPKVLFITCSDSRIETSRVTQMQPGQLFILRHVGNIVPRHGAYPDAAEASIEYAVNALKVTDIIICGHSHCGAMQSLLEPKSLAGLPAVAAFLAHAKETSVRMSALPDNLTEDQRVARAVEENVIVQLEQLQTHPVVQNALAQGKVAVHGWVYKLETGEVIYFDASAAKWRPL